MPDLAIRVAVIDDDPGDVELFRRYLEEIGDWQISLQAFTTFEEFHPQTHCCACDFDILFIDYLLGRETGLEVFLRLVTSGCEIPTIMLTGQGSEAVAVEAMKSGISDYLIKGQLSSKTLKKAIQHVLEKKALQRKIKEQQEMLAHLAVTDALTDLFNRRFLMKHLESEIQRVKRYKTSLCVIMLDLDFFKKVNDSYGHVIGDTVLVGTAKILKDELRALDIAARYGGEEFCMVLTNTDIEGARTLAERIRIRIAATDFRNDQGDIFHLTCSLGIALFGTEAAGYEDLLKAADLALYYSKEHGRNCVTVASEMAQG